MVGCWSPTALVELRNLRFYMVGSRCVSVAKWLHLVTPAWVSQQIAPPLRCPIVCETKDMRPGLSFTETTLGSSAASVNQDISFGRLLLGCSGPANDKGEEAAAKLEVGSNVQWRLTQANLQAGGRSLLRIGGPQFPSPEGFTLADTSLYMHAGDNMPGFDLTVRSVSDGVDDDLLVQSEAKAELCMSSTSGAPQGGPVTLLKTGTAQQTYRFGNGPPYRSVSVTRDVNAPDNRLFVSHGVVRSERSCNNTLDTLKGERVVQLGPRPRPHALCGGGHVRLRRRIQAAVIVVIASAVDFMVLGRLLCCALEVRRVPSYWPSSHKAMAQAPKQVFKSFSTWKGPDW
eukprot:s2142_g6.t1